MPGRQLLELDHEETIKDLKDELALLAKQKEVLEMQLKEAQRECEKAAAGERSDMNSLRNAYQTRERDLLSHIEHLLDESALTNREPRLETLASNPNLDLIRNIISKVHSKASSQEDMDIRVSKKS